MNETLIQKAGSKTVTYIIEDIGLLVVTSSKTTSTEINYSFEQIRTNKAIGVDSAKGALAIAAGVGGMALLILVMSAITENINWSASLFWAAISAGFFYYYFKSKNKKLYLQIADSKSLEFIANAEELDEVNNFVDKLILARNQYLLSKYANLSRNLEYAPQLDNLNWLLTNKAISKTQYDQKIQQLNQLFNNNLSNNPIGFSTGS